ncbi:MAG: lysine biosynthesis protein LysW [Candidatus Bipolaricaulaceae bacterium]
MCPRCRTQIPLSLYQTGRGAQFTCPRCGARLEVVEEDPLRLREAPRRPQRQPEWEEEWPFTSEVLDGRP